MKEHFRISLTPGSDTNISLIDQGATTIRTSCPVTRTVDKIVAYALKAIRQMAVQRCPSAPLGKQRIVELYVILIYD